MNNYARLAPSYCKTLAAILLLADQGKPITYRAIQKAAGYKSPATVVDGVRVLKRRGLVSQGCGSATIRPTCRFIPVSML